MRLSILYYGGTVLYTLEFCYGMFNYGPPSTGTALINKAKIFRFLPTASQVALARNDTISAC